MFAVMEQQKHSQQETISISVDTALEQNVSNSSILSQHLLNNLIIYLSVKTCGTFPKKKKKNYHHCLHAGR